MTKAQYKQTFPGEKPFCPQCEGIELRRQGRIGFWQRVVLPRFGLFPWECGMCRKMYLLRQRENGYRHQGLEAGITPVRLAASQNKS